MATFTKQQNGKWRVRVRMQNQSISKTFQFKSDAEIWATQKENEVANRENIERRERDKTTLGELLTRYIEDVAPNLAGADREELRALFLKKFDLADKPVYSITSQDIADFRNERLKNVSPSTVKKDMATLSSVFKHAMQEWGFVGLLNQVSLTMKPKGIAARRDVRLTTDERQLITQIPDEAIRNIAIFALETSVRLVEIIKIEWSDVDLQRRTVVIRHDKVGQKNGSIKRVPLNIRAVKVFSNTERKRPFCPDDTLPAVYAAWVSEQWKNKKVRWGFRKELWFRDLRHEAISTFFEKGLEVVEVMSITGHTNPSQLSTYTHLLHQESLASRLD